MSDAAMGEILAQLDEMEAERDALQAERDRLAKALTDVLTDIADYERVNNLSPNPGHKE